MINQASDQPFYLDWSNNKARIPFSTDEKPFHLPFPFYGLYSRRKTKNPEFLPGFLWSENGRGTLAFDCTKDRISSERNP